MGAVWVLVGIVWVHGGSCGDLDGSCGDAHGDCASASRGYGCWVGLGVVGRGCVGGRWVMCGFWWETGFVKVYLWKLGDSTVYHSEMSRRSLHFGLITL